MGDRAAAIGIGVLGLVLLAPAVVAQTPPPPPSPPASAPSSPGESPDARYTFSHVGEGYLRLDTGTGQVALCSHRQVGWACQLVPEDRLVLDSEISRLQSENGKLKKELLTRGIALPSGVSAPPDGAGAGTRPRGDAEQSSKDDLDRTLKTLTTMWTRLVEMIANFTRDVMKKS